ncbi:MAG: pitrilysin family protein [Candidatus Eremiobacterota bacterium]
MRGWALWAVLLVALALPARAEQPPTSAATVPGVRAARATPVGRAVLNNGMVVLVTESPGEDIVAVEVLIRVGLAEENAPLSGVTGLIQDVLQNRIARDASGQDELEMTGSLLTCTAEPDYARISLVTTSRDFPHLLDKIATALKKRDFSEAEVKDSRDKILNALRGDRGAFTQLYEIFKQNFYRYHPYKNNEDGTEASVSRLDAATVRKFYQEYYVPNRMVVCVSGRVSRTEVLTQARKDFSSMKSLDRHQLEIPWEPKASEKEIFLSANSSIAWVFLGYPAPSVGSRDYVAMKLIWALMGDGLSSRLFTEIREKRGLAYELGAVYPVLSGPSHMLTYTITKPEQVGRARHQIFVEIDRLKEHGVGEAELSASRRKLIGNYYLDRETNTGRAFNLALAEVVGVGYEFDVNFVREVQSVTPAEIQQVARRYLDNYTLVVARPGGRFYFDF